MLSIKIEKITPRFKVRGSVRGGLHWPKNVWEKSKDEISVISWPVNWAYILPRVSWSQKSSYMFLWNACKHRNCTKNSAYLKIPESTPTFWWSASDMPNPGISLRVQNSVRSKYPMSFFANNRSNKSQALNTTEGQELKISPRSAFHLHNLDFRSLPIFPKIALEFKHLFSYPKRLDSQQKHRYRHIFISYS